MSSCKDDGECEVNVMLRNMSTADKDDTLSVCANCGKEGSSDNMNSCNKCKQVKYCNAVCKKIHKKKHKKDCEEFVRRAAEKHEEELRLAAEKHDEELFKQPPPADDCPICFIRMPTMQTGRRYKTCCGKRICNGCVYAPVYDNQGNVVDNKTCPFCRTPLATTDDEIIKREKNRVEAEDPMAMHQLGLYYRRGMHGLPQDPEKALELYRRAGDLGNYEAYCTIGLAYENGEGVEVDKKTANHYYELAAMGGDADARCNLGINEAKAGNMDKSLKHFMIAAACGHGSLDNIKDLYSIGVATKEDYTKALQLYQEYLGEIKSVQRDKAAANYENCRYY